MTEEPHDQEYLELFEPKSDTPADDATQPPESVQGEFAQVVGDMGATQSARPGGDDVASSGREASGSPSSAGNVRDGGVEAEFESLRGDPGGPGRYLRTVGLFGVGGCLLLLLTAVVVFAFVQVFVRRGGDDDAQGAPTPTESVVLTPASTAPVTESPLLVSLISSDDVRVPVALPQRLIIGETVFTVHPVNTPAGAWPDVPTTDDAATWAYGTVINYILRLAPAQENKDLLSALQVGDSLSLHMSTGLILDFKVDEVTGGATVEGAFFEQSSPRLTLAWLADDPPQRTVVTASFFNDEAGDEALLFEAVTGSVGIPVDLGLVRVTVIEAYQVTAGEAGLPPDTGYLLVDFAVENLGTAVLETELFQTFVSDTAGGHYPLTMSAGQFTHYGLPTEPLAPGETVIGSAGYLALGNSESQVHWAFNPLPGSDNWVKVSVPFDLPARSPTPEPPPSAGFARVTVDSDDVFVDREDNLLIVGLEIENVSDGVVVVTEEDISLSSFPGGEALPVTAGPPLPWTVDSRESKLFELQFELPAADSALLSVLDYTFSIENLDRG